MQCKVAPLMLLASAMAMVPPMAAHADPVTDVLSGFDTIRNTRPDIREQNLAIVKSTMAGSTEAQRKRAVQDETCYSNACIAGRGLGGIWQGAPDGLGGATFGIATSSSARGKATYNNPRPYLVDPSIQPLVWSSGGSYPSGHTTKGFAQGLLTAYAFPERYQEILGRLTEYGNNRIINGVHYPLDVIGGRMLGMWSLVQALANPSDAAYTTTIAQRQMVIGPCNGRSIAECAAAGTGQPDAYGDYAKNKAAWDAHLTYGLPDVGASGAAMVVPQNAELLLRSRFPYLSLEQIREVLRTTAQPANVVLDNGNGWARLDLFRAADGFGELAADTTVTMEVRSAADDTKPGAAFNAADTWRNDIGGAGRLTKTGSGVLTLAGNNTFAGFDLRDGGLTFTGTNALTGSSTVSGGILTASGSTLGVANDLSIATGGVLRLDHASVEVGRTLRIDGGVDLAGPGEFRIGTTAAGNVTGTVAGSGSLKKTGAGPLVLAGANAFSGGVILGGGTLSVSREANLGASSGGLTFEGGILQVTGTGFTATSRAITWGRNGGGFDITDGTNTFSAAQSLSGPGSLAKLGAGTLALTGTNTYTGGTTIAAGSLALTPMATLVSPVLALAGATLTNAGSLTGGLVNAGTTTTSGLIAGGVTNTGTLTVSAGQINGAIRNQAGRFAVAGIVSSDATFANAAGATLTVSGRYALAELLTNAGTLAVADGGRLTAGSVDNSGVLTVAASASVVDALTNTGFVGNAGTYTADATNAAGATLINTGTFSTVSQPFANAGTLVTTGVLSGGLSNSGTVRASGELDGAVANTGLVRLIGPTTGIARLTNDGVIDLGGTTLTVGSLAGGTASATLANGRLTVGTDESSTTYAGRIVDGGSATSLTKVGAGVLTLSGDSAFTGPLTVLAGELSVTGTLVGTPIGFGAGTLLSGQATLASLTLGAGSTVAPGTRPGSLGQIAVTGNLTFAPGSTYQVDTTADGRSDRIMVGDRASLTGAAVQAIAGTGLYAPRTRYTILTANGGLSGQFAGVTSNFAFLTPFLGYDANDAYLTLARNDLDFGAVAQTRNQRGAASAVQAGGVGSPLYDAVATLSAPQARSAFAALSGDAHASLVSTEFATAGLLREAVLDRLRWDATLGAMAEPGGGRLPAAYTADMLSRPVPLASVSPRVFGLWGQGFGSTGSVRTDGDAAGLSRTTGGFVLGADVHLDDGLRLGLAGGYRNTTFATPDTAQSGTVDGTFGGVYGAYRAGPISVRFGALAADNAVSLRRLVLFPGFTGPASARTGGTTVQGFGEVGYRFALAMAPRGTAAVIEPFAGGAVVGIRRNRFAEQGGPVALSGARQDDTIPVSTVGVRGEVTLDLGFSVPMRAQGLLGYRYAFGDVTPATRLTVLGTGASFASAGLPIDRDAMVAEAGLSAQVAPNATLSVSYTGQVGQRAQDHTAKGNLIIHF